jgi:hypothetical protein
MERAVVAASAFAALVLGAEPNAHAYCRTSVCDSATTAQVCTPSYATDCGLPLYWPTPCVTFSIQENASPLRNITVAETASVVKTGFRAWLHAQCPTHGTIQMAVVEAPTAACDRHEYNTDAGNANIIMFRDDVWPYEGTVNTLALTTVTYDLNTAEIYDADMELNSVDNAFTLGNSDVDYDLRSIVTHETGHFLGMAHSHDTDATMFPSYTPGSTDLRDLSPDDIAGMCSIYPAAEVPSDCDPTPRHGFSPLCGVDQTSATGVELTATGRVQSGGVSSEARCSVEHGGAGATGRGPTWLLMAGVVGVAAVRGRRAHGGPNARRRGGWRRGSPPMEPGSRRLW